MAMVNPHDYTAAGLSGSEEIAGSCGTAAWPPSPPTTPPSRRSRRPVDRVPARRLIPCLGSRSASSSTSGRWLRLRPDGRYEFLFICVPLNLTGGVGSPANAVAIL